jgi:hypothetical protein
MRVCTGISRQCGAGKGARALIEASIRWIEMPTYSRGCMFYSAGSHIRRESIAEALPAMQETWTVCAPRDVPNFTERIHNTSQGADRVGAGVTFGYIHDGTEGKVGKTRLVPCSSRG